MKTRNKDNRSTRRTIATLASVIVLAAIIAGVVVAYKQLQSLWIEQCAITDVNSQVQIQTGKSIAKDTVRELFGLRNGANLALIDFARRREEVMKKYPVVKSIGISRRLPDGVSITVTEREPFARMGISGSKQDLGRVCDDEGVVFSRRRGAEMIPMIREASGPGTMPGAVLDGRSRAALSVLLAAREAEYSALNILEIDVRKPDYLLITLADHSAIKFRWNGMEKPTPESDAALRSQLTKVTQVIATNLSGATQVWNATQPGLITADTNRPN